MKYRDTRRGSSPTEGRKSTPKEVVLTSIPGLDRLLPGRYAPGETVRSRYGKWILPRSFKGRPIRLIVNGTLFG